MSFRSGGNPPLLPAESFKSGRLSSLLTFPSLSALSTNKPNPITASETIVQVQQTGVSLNPDVVLDVEETGVKASRDMAARKPKASIAAIRKRVAELKKTIKRRKDDVKAAANGGQSSGVMAVAITQMEQEMEGLEEKLRLDTNADKEEKRLAQQHQALVNKIKQVEYWHANWKGQKFFEDGKLDVTDVDSVLAAFQDEGTKQNIDLVSWYADISQKHGGPRQKAVTLDNILATVDLKLNSDFFRYQAIKDERNSTSSLVIRNLYSKMMNDEVLSDDLANYPTWYKVDADRRAGSLNAEDQKFLTFDSEIVGVYFKNSNEVSVGQRELEVQILEASLIVDAIRDIDRITRLKLEAALDKITPDKVDQASVNKKDRIDEQLLWFKSIDSAGGTRRNNLMDALLAKYNSLKEIVENKGGTVASLPVTKDQEDAERDETRKNANLLNILRPVMNELLDAMNRKEFTDESMVLLTNEANNVIDVTAAYEKVTTEKERSDYLKRYVFLPIRTCEN